MKKIHFDDMKNWSWISVPILSLILILTGSFEVFQLENPAINNLISGIGFFLLIIYFSRMFWYKNYVQWNKKGAVIGVNSFVGKSLNFNQIQRTELNDEKLKITKTDGKTVMIDLNEIEESDTQKLKEIIIKNTFANS